MSMSWLLDFFDWLYWRIEFFAQDTEIWFGYRDPGGNWIPEELRKKE